MAGGAADAAACVETALRDDAIVTPAGLDLAEDRAACAA